MTTTTNNAEAPAATSQHMATANADLLAGVLLYTICKARAKLGWAGSLLGKEINDELLPGLLSFVYDLIVGLRAGPF